MKNFKSFQSGADHGLVLMVVGIACSPFVKLRLRRPSTSSTANGLTSFQPRYALFISHYRCIRKIMESRIIICVVGAPDVLRAAAHGCGSHPCVVTGGFIGTPPRSARRVIAPHRCVMTSSRSATRFQHATAHTQQHCNQTSDCLCNKIQRIIILCRCYAERTVTSR